MTKVIIDTSVYIDFLRTNNGLYPLLANKDSSFILYTPTIVLLELYAGMSASDARTEKQVRRMISPTKIIDLTRQLSERSGELLRNRLVGETEDAIVAATALYLDAELATSNQKHFAGVKCLKLFKV